MAITILRPIEVRWGRTRCRTTPNAIEVRLGPKNFLITVGFSMFGFDRITLIFDWSINWTSKNEFYYQLRRLHLTPIEIYWSSVKKFLWQWSEFSTLGSDRKTLISNLSIDWTFLSPDPLPRPSYLAPAIAVEEYETYMRIVFRGKYQANNLIFSSLGHSSKIVFGFWK